MTYLVPGDRGHGHGYIGPTVDAFVAPYAILKSSIESASGSELVDPRMPLPLQCRFGHHRIHRVPFPARSLAAGLRSFVVG